MCWFDHIQFLKALCICSSEDTVHFFLGKIAQCLQTCTIKMMRFQFIYNKQKKNMSSDGEDSANRRKAKFFKAIHKGWLIGDLWVMQCRNSTEQQNWRQNQQRKMSDSPFNICFITLSQTDVVKVTYPFKECTDRLTENQVCWGGGDICRKGLVWWTLSLRGWICASLLLGWCHSTLHHFHYSLL